MIVCLFVVATITVTAWSQWVRRHTWGIEFERGTTLSCVFGIVGVILVQTPTSEWAGVWLHWLTGRWHVDDTLGYLCFLAAGMMGIWTTLIHLTDPDTGRAWYHRAVTPILLGDMAAMMAAFWLSNASHDSDYNIFDVPVHLGMEAFWALFMAGELYITAVTVWLLLKLWRDPRSRFVASVWLAATGVASFGVVALAGKTWLPLLGHPSIRCGGEVMRCCACVVVMLVAWSSAASWLRKMQRYRLLLQFTGARL